MAQSLTQSLIPPACYGYDPKLRSDMSAADLPKARAPLDTYGYADRDGHGYRENPDGSKLNSKLVQAFAGLRSSATGGGLRMWCEERPPIRRSRS